MTLPVKYRIVFTGTKDLSRLMTLSNRLFDTAAWADQSVA
jgi:hypothetical protein